MGLLRRPTSHRTPRKFGACTDRIQSNPQVRVVCITMLASCAISLSRSSSQRCRSVRRYSNTAAKNDKPRFVIFGPPGAGKGTQCAKLNKDYGLATLSTGDLLRKAIADKTEVGLRVKSVLAAGELVDDETVLALVTKAIDGSEQLQKDGFVLDGYPRTLSQADQLQTLLASRGLGLNSAVCLDVSDEVLIDRICNRWTHLPSGRVYHTTYNPPKKPGVDDETGEELTQREDDTVERVRARLAVYHQKTKPLLNYYNDKQLLITIKADTSHEGYELLKTALKQKYGISPPK